MVIKSLKYFLVLCILSLHIAYPQAGYSNLQENYHVRIAILKEAEHFVLSIRGRYKIIDLKTKEVLEEGKRKKRSRILSQQDGIHIGKNFYTLKQIRILPQKDVMIHSKKAKKRYRGAIDLVVDKKGKMLAINVLDLESYIKGVLYHEVTDRWPLEALKAQAVAARTYAVYQIEQNKDMLYDVTSDIYSQVYGGRSAERYRTNLAVHKTKGEVLLYNNEIVPAYFHSNSGGHTEDANELWGNNLTPLRGRPDPYAKNAPGYHWKKNFRLKDIQEKLNLNKVKVGLIKNIEVLERTKSGRVRQLEITARDGKRVKVSGKKFRQVVGPNLVRSNLYDVEMKGYFVDLIGKGWGHGVGMCQWGAHEMSRQKIKYDMILKFYYPESEIVNYNI